MKPLLTILCAMLSFMSFGQNESSKFINTIGNTGAKTLSMEYEISHDSNGYLETGTIVPVCNLSLRVLSAKFLIRSFTATDTFSINFYKVENGRPTTHVLCGPVIVYGKSGSKELNVDLTKDNITINEAFFIAISTRSDEDKKIEFGAGFGGNKSFHRHDITSGWEQAPMRLGFSAKVASDKDLRRNRRKNCN